MTDPARLIVIGGSAGSLQIILDIVQHIRPDLSIPILIVVHRKNSHRSALQEVIAARTSLVVKEVDDKETITPGTIYIAPADYHVLIENDHSFSLDHSEKVHYTRPSIDVSMLSAIEVYGDQLVTILLSGANADGAEGIEETLNNGGKAWVQDPDTAEVSLMPRSAIERSDAFVADPGKIADMINAL